MSSVGVLVIQAAVIDISDEQQLPTNQAILGIAGALGFVAGPLLGGVLQHRGSIGIVFGLAATVAAAQLAVTARLIPETMQLRGGRSGSIGDGRRGSSSKSDPPTPPAVAVLNPVVTLKRLLDKVTSTPRMLRLLLGVFALQSACEPKAWSASMILFMKSQVGLAPSGVGAFAAALAAAAATSKVSESVSCSSTSVLGLCCDPPLRLSPGLYGAPCSPDANPVLSDLLYTTTHQL